MLINNVDWTDETLTPYINAHGTYSFSSTDFSHPALVLDAEASVTTGYCYNPSTVITGKWDVRFIFSNTTTSNLFTFIPIGQDTILTSDYSVRVWGNGTVELCTTGMVELTSAIGTLSATDNILSYERRSNGTIKITLNDELLITYEDSIISTATRSWLHAQSGSGTAHITIDYVNYVSSYSPEGEEILERLPEHSPIHETDNPGYSLIIESIGPEFDNIYEDLNTNCDNRFLENATGEWLDRIGSWFGVYRGTLTDSEYRSVIIGLQSSNLTIAGIRKGLSLLLDVDETDITITWSNDVCKYNKSLLADHYSGTPQKYAGHYTHEAGVLNIIVPNGKLTLAETHITNMVLPGILVWITEEPVA